MKWQQVAFETLYASPSRNGVYKPKEFHGSGCRIVNMGELFGFDFISDQDMNRHAEQETPHRPRPAAAAADERRDRGMNPERALVLSMP